MASDALKAENTTLGRFDNIENKNNVTTVHVNELAKLNGYITDNDIFDELLCINDVPLIQRDSDRVEDENRMSPTEMFSTLINEEMSPINCNEHIRQTTGNPFNSEHENISNSSISYTSTSDMSVSDSMTNISKEVESILNIEESASILAENIEKTALSSLRNVIKDLQNQKEEERKRLTEYILRLEEEKDNLILKGSHAMCINQLEQQERELQMCKQEHDLDLRTVSTLKLELDAMKKKYELANKEKEATVMRYAKSEMEVIKQKQEMEGAEKKLKESLKERDVMMSKLKSLSGEKGRICQMLDSKCLELTALQKDVERLKDEVNTKDIKIKWAQNKLRVEVEAHKESELRVEKLTLKLQEAHEEVEQAKKDAQDTIKKFYESQENRAFVLDQQLKELQAQLILERHSFEDKESTTKQLQHEVDTLKAKHQLYIDENNALLLKVQSLEKEKVEHEHSSSKLKETSEKQSQHMLLLQTKLQELETLKTNLLHDQQCLSACQSEVSQLRTRNAELEQDIVSCKEREADMLEFTQKVTTKNVRLQSEFSCMEKKAHQLQCEEEPLLRRVSELESLVETLEKELEKEKADRIEEKKVIARHLAEKTAKVETLLAQIEDLKGETQVNKHKHAATVRELNRELLQCRKRLEQYDLGNGSDSLNQGSRTSSCTSLNEQSSTTVFNNQVEPDRQSLIERIVKLQRINAKYSEKNDFLEEHAQQLVSELQKKTRVLQSYILREEAGALTSTSMDNNKAEFAKHSGIMASMYGSKTVDESITLELCLEINRKLQAVLEDTLLKNITLKENIDTLGDEITRLTQRYPKS